MLEEMEELQHTEIEACMGILTGRILRRSQIPTGRQILRANEIPHDSEIPHVNEDPLAN